MSINYTNLFTDVGKILKYLNTYRGYSTSSLETAADAIGSTLTTNGRYEIASGIPTMFDGFKDNVTGWINNLSGKIQDRVVSYETVVSQLPLGQGAGISDIFVELIKDMIANTVTINRSTVTIGTVTAGGSNVGDAQVMVTKVLDAVSPPASDAFAVPSYRGVDSELCVASETMTLTCVRDSYNGATAGSEAFAWVGGLKGNGPFDWKAEGSDNGPTLTVANNRGYFANNEFEDWTVADTPDNWTLGTGAVAGTTVLEGTSSPKRGSSYLRMVGDGATAAIPLTQAPLQSLTPGKSYCIGFWLQGQAGITGTSAFTAMFTGTGYTAGSTEKVSLNAAALAALTSWGWKYFFVNIPAVVPTDFALEIKCSGTLTNTKHVDVDGLICVETLWHGGVGVAIGAGATGSVIGDRFTFTIANDNAGVFQTFMRKKFRVQLPSSGSPSIADSLAT